MTEFSFQLYSARKFPPVRATLEMLAEVGYRQVEGYSGLYESEPDLAAELSANGLTMPTGHFGIDALRDVPKTAQAAKSLGIGLVICPSVPQAERGQDEAGWTALAATLQGLAEAYNRAGLAFAWHNHAFEFVELPSGKMPMHVLLEQAPALQWEVDVAWMIKAKQAPFDWFEPFGDRITAVHVKDIALEGENTDEDGWADVGYGTLDWQGLFTEIKSTTKARHFIMEHDNPSDPARFARRSLETAKTWK
jgi:sugar phosphate isomerase/epimerase